MFENSFSQDVLYTLWEICLRFRGIVGYQVKGDSMAYKVLIIEDDEVIAEIVKEALERWGYQAGLIQDFRNVTEEVAQFRPDLILLDINLPFYNGFYWCRELRQFTKVSVIFLSSADDNMNIVMAMDMGGDDFIAKPFDINVLLAKVNAVIRRSYDYQGKVNALSVGDVVLNLDDAAVTYQGEKIELTNNEYKIFKLLMQNRGKMVSRDAIMACLWESEEFVDDNTLTVNVARIRKKLKNIGIDDMIKTKKGVGYLIEEGFVHQNG